MSPPLLGESACPLKAHACFTHACFLHERHRIRIRLICVVLCSSPPRILFCFRMHLTSPARAGTQTSVGTARACYYYNYYYAGMPAQLVRHMCVCPPINILVNMYNMVTINILASTTHATRTHLRHPIPPQNASRFSSLSQDARECCCCWAIVFGGAARARIRDSDHASVRGFRHGRWVLGGVFRLLGCA